MNITVIGSMKQTVEMLKIKDIYSKLGNDVFCPCDPERKNLTLLGKQTSWIEHIESSDIIIAIPKETKMFETDGDSTVIGVRFGESTSYEIAIANHFNKDVMIWGFNSYS